MTKGTLLVTILSFALAFSAFAQEREVKTGGAGKEETVKLMVNGWANVYWAFTNGDLNESSLWDPDGVPDFLGDPDGDDNDSNLGLVAEVSLRFQASLQDAVDVVVELRTRDTRGVTDADGTNYVGDSSGNGSAIPRVRQGYVQVHELIAPEVTTKIGLQPVKFDIRGRGNALFLDSDNAESAFASGIAIGGVDDQVEGVVRVRPETLRDELIPAGITLAFKRDKLALELAAVEMIPGETNMGEPHNLENDESLYSASFLYDMDDQGSRLGGIVALMKAGEKQSRVWTFGGGASLKNLGQKGLEVFAEGYLQTGTAYDDAEDNDPDDVDAKGFLVNAGVRFEFDSEGNPWVEASFLWVSGQEDDNGNGELEVTEDETDEFFSYEGNDDLLILEDHVVGLDIDNNYWTGRAKLGVNLGEKKNIRFEAKAAVATAVEDIGTTPTNGEDALGWEFDVSLTYVLNKNASVYIAGGWLTGADVLELFTREEEDSAFAVKLGTWVNW